jgi:hypothetical protein
MERVVKKLVDLQIACVISPQIQMKSALNGQRERGGESHPIK